MARILVINPNSSQSITQALSLALEPLRFDGGPRIDCISLAEGPPGIETQAHVDAASAHVCATVQREAADAYVIACFSDPGLYAAREITDKPVFGIAESGILAALALGQQFGLIAILDRSIPRHLRYVATLGQSARLAGDRAINSGVAGLADESVTMKRLIEVGSALRDHDGAEVLVLGCAGMARFRSSLEQVLGLPVVDPTQAAVGMAVTTLRLGWQRAQRGKTA
jgi:allantoin racemase